VLRDAGTSFRPSRLRSPSTSARADHRERRRAGAPEHRARGEEHASGVGVLLREQLLEPPLSRSRFMNTVPMDGTPRSRA
jgi:hypothetical protein